jgi:DNA-binding NarL/FixJ family response regulator
VTIRTLVADDQLLVRAGFRKILEAEADIEVVADAGDGLEAVELARRTRPDVALLDIRMPRRDGIEAARQIVTMTPACTRVMMLTTFGIDEYVFEALKAGASGFLLKDTPPDQLVEAVRLVAGGEALLSPRVTRSVIERFVTQSNYDGALRSRITELTQRETEVLRLLTRGLSNAELARELTVSEATVKSHIAGLLDKLAVRDRVQAVIAAYESGLVRPGDNR